jgi:hypothetical protein
MTKTVTIDDETADGITKCVLLEMYEDLKRRQNSQKENYDNFKDFEKEDYDYDANLLEATKVIICYFTTPDERPEELTDL